MISRNRCLVWIDIWMFKKKKKKKRINTSRLHWGFKCHENNQWKCVNSSGNQTSNPCRESTIQRVKQREKTNFTDLRAAVRATLHVWNTQTSAGWINRSVYCCSEETATAGRGKTTATAWMCVCVTTSRFTIRSSRVRGFRELISDQRTVSQWGLLILTH